ncbi:oxidoreductase, partial [Nocardia flavorosea]
MSWSSADIPDQRGRVAVVTGANSGLGLETARQLAARGAHIVLAARNQHTARAAVASIESEVPGASLEIISVDLGVQTSVREAARRITAGHPRLDLLINNAGVMAGSEARTVDGYERQLGVDHLGHWTLTGLLLPNLLGAADPRVVTVTSMARHLGQELDKANPHLTGRYDPWRAYGQAKLANFHFALGLHRLFGSTGVRAASLVAHPGAARTNLTTATVQDSGTALTARLLDHATGTLGQSAKAGALPQLRAATDPAARSGELYAPLLVGRGRPVSRPILRRIHTDRAIDTLWEVSERETGV